MIRRATVQTGHPRCAAPGRQIGPRKVIPSAARVRSLQPGSFSWNLLVFRRSQAFFVGPTPLHGASVGMISVTYNTVASEASRAQSWYRTSADVLRCADEQKELTQRLA